MYIETKKDLSIILPSYKEGDNLKILLPQLIKVLESLVDNYEIIVIDTIEPLDDTPYVCEQYGVRYFNEQKENNYGNAVRMGIEQTQGIYTICMDADGSCTPDFISQLYAHRKENDVVIASRYIQGGHNDSTAMSVILSRILNFIFAKMLNINCSDFSISFKLYKTEDLKRLHLVCKNFDINQEIIFKLRKYKKNLVIKELPFSFEKRIYGESKRNFIIFTFSYLGTMIRLLTGK